MAAAVTFHAAVRISRDGAAQRVDVLCKHRPSTAESTMISFGLEGRKGVRGEGAGGKKSLMESSFSHPG